MGLGSFVLRRLALILPVILGLTLLTFTLSHVVPGDPALLAAGPQATPDMVEQVRREFGFDAPLPVQYLNYLKGLVSGNWGRSVLSRRPVLSDLAVYWPATLELVLAAMTIAVVSGIPLGVISAVRHDRWPDHLSRAYSLLGVSMPAFVLAIVLQWFIALRTGMLPLGGRIASEVAPPDHITGLYIVDSIATLNFEALKSSLVHIVLPALTLSMAPVAIITRMTRSSMLDVLSQDYIRTSRAKGLAERNVIVRHALRNAFMPTLTMIGLSLGWLMGGSLLVESIFDWPGIGLYAVKSALSLDFMPIMGITFLYGVVFSLINLGVDVLYAFVDPRVRFS
jgi:peptide/nickel transport system permease protein